MLPISDSTAVLALLAICVLLAERLSKRGPGRHLGTAVLVIALGALLGNSGLVPAASTGPAVYAGVFEWVAPASIFLLLLDVHFAALARAGGPMLIAFGLGAVGTLCGVALALQCVDLEAVAGEHAPVLAGMFTGTYTGGSANFNAIALEFDIVDEGPLMAGAIAVDNLMGVPWILVVLALPKLLRRFARMRSIHTDDRDPAAPTATPAADSNATPTLSISGVAALLALTTGALYLADRIAAACSTESFAMPSILVLTTLGLLAAQIPAVRAMRSSNLLGLFAAYLFLCVVGAHCEVASLGQLGDLGPALILLVGILLVVHTLVLAGAGYLLRIDPDILAMGSNATLLGSATAPAVAQGIGRHDLVLPGILAGTLGNAVGTYLGFTVVALAR